MVHYKFINNKNSAARNAWLLSVWYLEQAFFGLNNEMENLESRGILLLKF